MDLCFPLISNQVIFNRRQLRKLMSSNDQAFPYLLALHHGDELNNNTGFQGGKNNIPPHKLASSAILN